MRTLSTIVYAAAAFLPLVFLLAAVSSEGDQLTLLSQIAVALSWLGCALYVVFALNSSTVPPARRRLMVIVLVLGGALALPYFWYTYIWRPSRG